MLRNKVYRLLNLTILLFLLSGCIKDQQKDSFQMVNNQGIFFNVDNSIIPVYSLIAIDNTDFIGTSLSSAEIQSMLLSGYYNEKEKIDLPVNELSVGESAQIFFNKNFEKPVFMHIICSDSTGAIITPYLWESEPYVQFDIHNLKKDIEYTFQVSYIKQTESEITNIETYIFRIIFK